MINLLPKEVKEKYASISKIYGVTLSYVLVVAILGLGATGLATYNYIQQTSLGSKQSQLDSLVSEEHKSSDLAKKAAFIEDRLNSSSRYQEKANWSDTLAKIANDTPSNIALTSLKLTTVNNMEISGNTKDQRSVILYKQRLGQESSFTNPLIASLSETNGDNGLSYTFTITFGVNN